MTLKPIRQLAVAYPHIAREFDIAANDGITPDQVSAGSSRKFWWKCSTCGHQWIAPPYSRTAVRSQGCPKCGRKRAAQKCHLNKISGKNTLAEKYPAVATDWDYEKNDGLTPDQVSAHTATKVWWHCEKCGQSWQMTVNKRTQKNRQGCPVCAGVKVVPGVNDFASRNPHLVEEWDFSLNHCKPSEVTVHSNKRVHWICSICGHHWSAAVASRSAGSGCPKCMRVYTTSMPEQILFYYLRQVFPDTINGYHPKWLPSHGEIDIYIPSQKIGIEYDGIHWHPCPEKDQKKGLQIKKHGIILIRVRDHNSPAVDDDSIRIDVLPTNRGYRYMNPAIAAVFNAIMQHKNCSFDLPVIDSERDVFHIQSCVGNNLPDDSLASVRSDLLEDWDFEANGCLNPVRIRAKSETKVHWCCSKCGFKWSATIASRTAGHGCPFCAGLTVREGFNDLQTMRPEVADEWDYSANEKQPSQMAYRSAKKAAFICKKCGNHYIARIADRSAGSGCPVCSGRIPQVGVSDLATLRPDLLIDWDYAANPLPPSAYKVQSNKPVAWKCHVCGYQWQAPIYSRSNGRGCEKCGKRSMAAKRDKRHILTFFLQIVMSILEGDCNIRPHTSFVVSIIAHQKWYISAL